MYVALATHPEEGIRGGEVARFDRGGVKDDVSERGWRLECW